MIGPGAMPPDPIVPRPNDRCASTMEEARPRRKGDRPIGEIGSERRKGSEKCVAREKATHTKHGVEVNGEGERERVRKGNKGTEGEQGRRETDRGETRGELHGFRKRWGV